MPTSAKPRRRYRARPVDTDPMGLAYSRAARLAPDQREPIHQVAVLAFQAFRQGQGDAVRWMQLADALNTAEALADAGIAADHRDTFLRAQAALAAVHGRVHRRTPAGSYTLYPAEITALDDAVFVHGIQLQHCSQGELHAALLRVKRRVQGALQGNAPAGARLCLPGLLGADATTQGAAA